MITKDKIITEVEPSYFNTAWNYPDEKLQIKLYDAIGKEFLEHMHEV